MRVLNISPPSLMMGPTLDVESMKPSDGFEVD